MKSTQRKRHLSSNQSISVTGGTDVSFNTSLTYLTVHLILPALKRPSLIKILNENIFRESELSQNFIKLWLPVILWMGVIFWMSTGMFSSENTSHIIGPLLHYIYPSISPQAETLIHGLIRKTGHVIEYFILGLLFFRAFRGESLQTWCLRWAIYAIIGVALYALSDEFHQAFVATRTASIFDVSIDSAGGFLSQVAMFLWNFRHWKLLNKSPA